MESLKLKKIFLYTLIVSVVFSALMGIWVILANRFNEFQGRVLATTLTVVVTSILGLACGAFLESSKAQNSPLKIVPILGMLFSFAAALISLGLIWQILGSNDGNILKAFAITSIFAFCLSQLSLLSLANLSDKFKWALTAAYLVILILAALWSFVIIMEADNDDNFVTRYLGVLGIIDAALTVMIPIFHRLSRNDFTVAKISVKEIDAKIEGLKDELRILEKQREEILNRQN